MFAERLYLPLCVLFCLTLGLVSEGHADALTVGKAVSLGKGEQRVLEFGQPLKRVAISDPDVAAVSVSDKQELLVTAKSEGTAVLSVWLRGQDRPLQSPVVVSRTSGQRLSFGMQVQTDIRIVEVNRNELNELGAYYSKLFDGGTFAASFAGANATVPVFGGIRSVASSGFNFFRFGSSSLSIINAMESAGFAYTLAEPSLVTLSGQSATFLSGGEFPIPVESGNDGVKVVFKKFGVSLGLTPTVVNEDQIILKVAPEVSDLDFSSGVSTGGVTVPGLRVRRTETTVSMAPGETFIISGLVSRNTVNSSDRIPGLGDLPVIGALFRSDRISRDKKELIMVVTPHIVTASDAPGSERTTIARDYDRSSMDFFDMAAGSAPGDRPIKHGFSW